jgi:predicted nucleic acid-binding protein
VILIDANILIYAHVTSFAQHKPARDWLDQQLNASAPVGLPWASVLAFLRLVTNLLVMLGSKCAPGLLLSRPGSRSLQNGTSIYWANFSRYLASTAI